MDKHLVLLSFFLSYVLLSLNSCNQQQVRQENPYNFPTQVKVAGDLADRMQLTERRLAGHPFSLRLVTEDIARREDYQRRFEEYEGDVSGRTLGAWSYLSRLTGQRPAKLDSLAEQILSYQTPEGYFGVNQQPEGWDYWGRQIFGHGRLLVGLVEYYRLSHDDRFLQAAKKLGDYLAAGIPGWTTAHQGNPWDENRDPTDFRSQFIKTHYTSVMEGLVLLYEISGEEKYLEAARTVVPLLPEFGVYHSHSYMNTLVGIAKLYLHTGVERDRNLLTDIYWQDIKAQVDQPDGGTCEYFPVNRRTEGCSVTDWLRLNLHMWAVTGEGRYMDEAENIWWNALNFHQTHNGAFGHSVMNARGYEAPYSESWWCCTMHGMFAHAALLKFSAAGAAKHLWVNLYAPLESKVTAAGVPVEIRMHTDYPAEGNISITVFPEHQTEFVLRLRVPEWAQSTYQVQVNGDEIEPEMTRGYAVVRRVWKPGDQVSLRLPIELRVEDGRGNTLSDDERFYDVFTSATIHRGPMLLASDLHYNDALPDTLYLTPEAAVDARPEVQSDHFRYPENHVQLPAWINGRRASVTLVPMAEQTGYGEWADELPTFRRNGEEPIQRVPVRIKFTVKRVGDSIRLPARIAHPGGIPMGRIERP
ncbi:MAG TPA: beta-L-arabinofuranosidase domain-containing protein [bacterium]|nr:beta-L-arabinofuranosidase domain-containing protein [bacterium]